MKIYTEKDYNTGELNILTMQRKHLIRVLKMCRGKKNATAHVIGVTPRTVSNMFIQHQIKDHEYIS